MKSKLLHCRRIRRPGHIALILLFAFFTLSLSAQISFEAIDLSGENINNPTTLQFGPDGRLYVGTKGAQIFVYTIERTKDVDDNTVYTVTDTEVIKLVQQNTPNHNDNGDLNTEKKRQVTGLLVTGTAADPVLYVTSSDWRIAVGNDSNLDTNSGVISRLTKTANGWAKVDLVRGLSRCEENHSINGLDITPDGNTLFVMVGGNTNKGAPGNNFSGTPEYWTSGALLSVDLNMLDEMDVYNDPRTNTQYVYDMPTLNDPSRTDIDNTHDDFPYEDPLHPMYDATIDINDPFGGNNGANMAITEPGGPVQIYSGGYRNAYDVVYTSEGKLFTSDNGPNGGWGGQPLVYDQSGSPQGIVGDAPFPLPAGWYITNEFNETGSSGHGDVLFNIQGQGYYAGHPTPIRAFPEKAGIIIYEEVGGVWTAQASYQFADLLVGVSGYFNSSFNIGMFPDKPAEASYHADLTPSLPGNIDIISSSTNGITEYTASNFDGAMQGHILTASFNGNINQYEIAPDGNSYLDKKTLAGGFGSQPLDVTAQGDDDIFPGTIWVATYGADNITVFEPVDFGNCPTSEDDDYDSADVDSDNDGYSNADEVANGTNICSGASTPSDNDGDNLSDLLDNDDDNDGILDPEDAFAIDPDNGMNTTIPINYPFENDNPGTGFFGLGFTGLMKNGSTDYLYQFDEEIMAFGGAAGKASIEGVPPGDAYQNNNNQEYAFQFGVNNSATPFTVHAQVESPFFADPETGDAATPENFQSLGIFIGTGDQDNYLKVVLNANGGSGGIQVLKEVGGSTAGSANTFGIGGLLAADAIDIYLTCDPSNNTVQPFISTDVGINITPVGSPVSVPASWMDPTDGNALAVGLIATSTGADPFLAIWDFINVLEENMMANLEAETSPVDFGQVVEGTSTVTKEMRVLNQGGPSAGSIEVTAINFSGTHNAEFSYTGPLPITIGPGATADITLSFDAGAVGQKTASVELVHSGDNSPLIVPLQAEVIENFVPLFRVNAGGPTIPSIDAFMDWAGGALETQYLMAGGNGTSGFSINSFDGSVDQTTTPTAIFQTERYDGPSGDEMKYSFPVDLAGDYEVRLYLGNGCGCTDQIGERIFDVTIEGQLLIDDLDLIDTYGHLTGAMQSFVVNVTDGSIDIEFLHQTENPLINGIEILGPGSSVANPIIVQAIPNQFSEEEEDIDSPTVMASGGSGANFAFSASNLPPGLDIEPTNGQIYGTIAAGAADNSPYTVTVTVETDDPIDQPVEETFTWSIVNPAAGDILFRVNNGGPEVADAQLAWSADQATANANGSAATGTPSPYLDLSSMDAVDKTFGPNTFTITNATGAPDNIFAQERYSDAANPNNMQWNFPVDDGDYIVTLFFAENWTGANSAGARVFDVEVEGAVVLDDYDVFVAAGNALNVAVAETFTTTVSDGTLDIDFIKMTQNPALKGIEIRAAETGPKPSATVSVTSGNSNINASVYNTNSFSVSNTSTDGQKISSVTFDLSTNMLPEIVFDPDGTAGDETAKAFTVGNNNTSGTISSSLSQPFGNGGYQQLDVTYTDFQPGESMTFAIDVDPTSIEGLSAPGPGESGSVSGLELAGTTVTINFDDGTSYTNTLFSDGSNAGAVASLRQAISPTPTLDVLGLSAPTTVNSPNQTLEISGGPPNGTISLLQVEAGFFEGGGDLMQMPFEANSAIAVSRTTGITLDGSGGASVPVILTDSDPEGGYNYFIIAVEDGTDFGLASNVIVLEYDADATPPPTTGVLYRINVGGAELTAADNSSPAWSVDNSGSPSPFRVAGSNGTYSGNNANAHPGAINMANPSIPPSAPAALFNIERWDNPTAPEMKWEFPIPGGTEVEVRLFFCELFGNVDMSGERVFDVTVEGSVPAVFDDIDQFAIAGAKGAFMLSHTLTVQDGTLDLEFIHGVENPNLKGIEILGIDAGDNEAPMVMTPATQTNQEGDMPSLQIQAIDDSDNLSYSATGLPPSLSIDVNTGLISGTIDAGAAANSPYMVSVTVTDDGVPVKATTVDFSWEVTDGSGATLAGTIGNTACEGSNVIVEIYEENSTNLVSTETVPLGMNGEFNVSNITPGTYQISVKLENSLAVVETVTLVSGNNDVDFGTLAMGDANNDNLVTTADFTILGAAINTQEGDAGFNPLADFNCDGLVTTADFTILGGNINTAGEEPGGI